MFKIAKLLFLFVTLFAVLKGTALAQTSAGSAGCQVIYGGGQACPQQQAISVVKQVQVPGKGGGNFVNKLTVNDVKFAPNQPITFQITVKNTSSQAISNINLTDTFPKEVTFVSGVGNFNSNNNTLSFNITNLAPDKSQVFTIVGKTASDSSLPQNSGTFCGIINAVSAMADEKGPFSAQTEFCIQKQVLGAVPQAQSLPSTGPELLPLIALLPGGMLGFALRRKSAKGRSASGGKISS